MPLPENDSGAWPPPSEAGRLERQREARVWYGGDPARLAARYGGSQGAASSHIGTTINPQGRGVVQRSVGVTSGKFWSSAVAQGEEDTRRHLPIASDIAILSSEWLFGEPPTFKVLGPVWETDAEAIPDPTDPTAEPTPAHRKGDPKPETVKAQAALDAILKASGAEALFLASAEISSALGSMPFRIVINREKFDTPRLVRVDPQNTVPIYSWGSLEGVVFWRVVTGLSWAGSGTVVRHLELHEGGRIFHGLYQGSPEQLGKLVPMTDGDAQCRAIASNLDEESAIVTKFEFEGKPLTTATSIPNVLPDPLDLENLAGRSDYTPPVIDLMDSADRIYSQLMENVDDAKGRILIGRQMLESAGVGRGLTFDSNQRIFHKLNVPPAEKEGASLPIEKVQFELRAVEYLGLLDAITSKAIEAAGWNPETDADGGGDAMTATEVHDRRKRSNATRDKKLRYVESELERLAFSLLAIYVQEFKPAGVNVYPVEVSFPESVQPSQLELANTAKILREAKIASLQVSVAMVHPDWTEPQVAEEVARLQTENRSIDPATIGLSTRLPGDPAAAPVAGGNAAAPTATQEPA